MPDDMELIVTRNYGLTANEKVNELVEGLCGGGADRRGAADARAWAGARR